MDGGFFTLVLTFFKLFFIHVLWIRFFYCMFTPSQRCGTKTNTKMTHLPTLQKAKELITFEFYQTWVNKMQGNQEGDWITTHQMVKAYWFGGDTPKFSEWEKLTNHVFQSCIVIAMNETKK